MLLALTWAQVGYVVTAWVLCLVAYLAYTMLFRRRRRRGL
jgi:hypothetical protein